jgi:hypothetical protein
MSMTTANAEGMALSYHHFVVYVKAKTPLLQGWLNVVGSLAKKITAFRGW